MARLGKPIRLECKNPPGKALKQGSPISIVVRQRRGGWIAIRLDFAKGTFKVKHYAKKEDAEGFVREERDFWPDNEEDAT